MRFSLRVACLVLLCLAAIAAGCRPSSTNEVIVYAALDQEFSAPVLDTFTRKSGIDVRALYDIESTKTVGLVNRLLQEKNRPVCDVFWNNEVLHTLRLEKAGVLTAYISPAAANIPEEYRSPTGLWTGLAARARVLIVNTDRVSDGDLPTSVEDLAAERWKGQAGIARPLFGTTATHAAVLFDQWGNDKAWRFFEHVRSNAVVLSGNKHVAQAVARGELAFGLTDTDDAMVEIRAGRPVKIVFPDQQPQQPGALLIPNSICIMRGAPHPEAARKLIDYLLSAEVEERLQAGDSAQFPLNVNITTPHPIADAEQTRWMSVDFRSAADLWETVAPKLYELFRET